MKNVVALVCFVVLSLTRLSGSPQEEPELKKLKTLKSEPLAVVQVGNEVRIIKKSELPDLKKELETKYRAAAREYLEARSEARKAKREFTNPRPVKESLSILAASVKTQEEAEKVRDKALNEFLVISSQDRLKVIRKLEFASFKAKTESEYRVALARYNEAKKAARRSKQSFKESAPAKPRIKVVASRLESEESALEKMSALEKKGAKSRARTKTTAKKKGKGSGKGNDKEIEDEEPDRLE